MTVPARALLSDLPKGHPFPETTLRLTHEDVARYLDAVADANPLYLERGLAPPLAAAAHALGALLERVELPGGTLHTGQEIAVDGGVPIDAPLTFRGGIAQRSERAGMVIAVLEFELTPEGRTMPALTGRTTVMMPARGGQ